MANKNEVTISLEEYKELLLKERPDNNDKWILGKIKEFIVGECKLKGEEVEVRNTWDFEDRLLKYIKIIDKQFYKEIVKKVYDEEIEEQSNKLKMEKARKIKEIEKEN